MDLHLDFVDLLWVGYGLGLCQDLGNIDQDSSLLKMLKPRFFQDQRLDCSAYGDTLSL